MFEEIKRCKICDKLIEVGPMGEQYCTACQEEAKKNSRKDMDLSGIGRLFDGLRNLFKKKGEKVEN